MSPRASAHRTSWGITPTSPKRPGMRIQRGKHNVFVPDDELFDLASQIADHLADHLSTTTTTNRKAA